MHTLPIFPSISLWSFRHNSFPLSHFFWKAFKLRFLYISMTSAIVLLLFKSCGQSLHGLSFINPSSLYPFPFFKIINYFSLLRKHVLKYNFCIWGTFLFSCPKSMFYNYLRMAFYRGDILLLTKSIQLDISILIFLGGIQVHFDIS